jgi:small GTP-binding protein
MSQFLVSRPSFSGTVSLWDTAGMEKYRVLAPIYCRDASGAIVVYDVGNRPSFDHLLDWVRIYRADGRERSPAIIVGNKADKGGRAATAAEGRLAAAQQGLAFVETSAKDRTGIAALIDEIARLLSNCPPRPVTVVRYSPRVKNVVCC